MKIIFFFLEGNKNCRVGTKKKQSLSGEWKHEYFLGLITTDNVKKKNKEKSHKAKQSMSKSRENMFSGISDQVRLKSACLATKTC